VKGDRHLSTVGVLELKVSADTAAKTEPVTLER